LKRRGWKKKKTRGHAGFVFQLVFSSPAQPAATFLGGGLEPRVAVYGGSSAYAATFLDVSNYKTFFSLKEDSQKPFKVGGEKATHVIRV